MNDTDIKCIKKKLKLKLMHHIFADFLIYYYLSKCNNKHDEMALLKSVWLKIAKDCGAKRMKNTILISHLKYGLPRTEQGKHCI